MSYFNAKMHEIRFQLGLHPRPRLGCLQCSPRPSWLDLSGPTSKGKEGRGEEGNGEVVIGHGHLIVTVRSEPTTR